MNHNHNIEEEIFNLAGVIAIISMVLIFTYNYIR